MDIKLNDILHLDNEEIANSKIELNIRDGITNEFFLNRWLTLSEEEKRCGVNNISYWPYQGKNKNYHNGQTVFSFIRMTGDEWLFISAAKINSVPDISEHRAPIDEELEIIERYQPLFGRLIMKFHKGNTYQRYTFNLNYLRGNESIKAILPGIYTGEQFEGYDKVNLSYSKLNDILNKKIMPTYFEALSKITGIYCLTDTHTGKLYIGSASGEEGVAQRWRNYLDSKDGGNKKLIELHKERGEEYFKKYFTFTLIEYFGLSYDKEKILDREKYWKKCFDTVKNGYNDNY